MAVITIQTWDLVDSKLFA